MDLKQLAAAALICAASAAASAQAPAALMFGLSAQSRDGRVLVNVLVENKGAATAYVPRALAEDEEPFGKLFIVSAENGAPLDYLGPMVKRGPMGPEDYVGVQPRASLRHTLDISRSYAFLPGTHTYTLSYKGPLPLADLKEMGQPEGLAPPAIQFVHTAK